MRETWVLFLAFHHINIKDPRMKSTFNFRISNLNKHQLSKKRVAQIKMLKNRCLGINLFPNLMVKRISDSKKLEAKYRASLHTKINMV
jgi:hypothetical protein